MSIADSPSLTSLRPLQQQLIARLSHLRAKIRRRLLVAGLARLAIEIAAAVLLLFVIDRFLRLNVPARAVLLLVALVLLIWETHRLVVAPLRIRLGLQALAGAIERAGGGQTPHLAAHVATVLELPRLLETPDPPSPIMIERAVRRGHVALTGLNFDAALDIRRPRMHLAYIAAALIVPAIFAAIFPSSAGLWARRLFTLSHQP